MILIADSGSSKTDWVLLSSDAEKKLESKGINPFFQDTIEITKSLTTCFTEVEKNKVQQIFFYGAGCIPNQTDAIVYDALHQTFPTAEIFVYDDLVGAARALLDKQKGIACILGTGANSCYYDGVNIADKVPTLGYILGDEGSGAYLGKIFINDYFKRALPTDFHAIATEELKLHWPDVLQKVYKQPYPNRYLASFSAFFAKHKEQPYIQQLLSDAFSAFLQKNVLRYPQSKDVPVAFVGSIAYHYTDVLQRVCEQHQVTLGTVLQQPIQGLRDYHLADLV